MPESPRRRFENKVALVTGGSAGIGLATAKAFAAEGARVVIAARRPDVGAAAVEHIRKLGGEAHFVPTDMADPESVKRMVGATIERYGGLDVAYNNAGMTGDTSTAIDEADEAMFAQVMAVNTTGVWYATKYEFRAMKARGGGSIVICGSSASFRGGAGRASGYYTSKHALMGLMKQAALDGAAHNIRVNAVLPGLVMTELTAKGFANAQDKLKLFFSRIPMSRAGQVEEIANAVLFLASEDSSYITGVGLPVDGGATV
jgi:NAD(P)-dependent dehydrogenase (short-subunit alcohol dehydrogenase family)